MTAPDGARLYLDVNALTDGDLHLALLGAAPQRATLFRLTDTGEALEIIRAALRALAAEQAALARPVAAPRAPSEEPVLAISEEEIELLREHAESVVESYAYPEGDACKQPTEWHEGRKLWALANRMADYFKARLAYLAGAAPQQNNRDGTYNPPESRGAVGQGTSLADGPIDTYWHRRRAVEPLHGRITGCLCDACQNERGYHALLAAAAPPPKPT